MEPLKRKPFEGTINILKFNWPLYVLALLFTFVLMMISTVAVHWQLPLYIAAVLALLPVITSLAVSWYIYDRSGLYDMRWLQHDASAMQTIFTVHAGFDESTAIVAHICPGAQVHPFDFYDPARHTESSIARARKAYPPYPGTEKIKMQEPLPVEKKADLVILFLAAHEIRQREERIAFFRMLSDALQPGGKIVVVEHLRDAANLAAYQVGAFHFHSRREWLATFGHAQLSLASEIKITPFISAFTLIK